ncbi:putative heme peroxidase [Rosistilla oblonga]|uniref:hydrogen peroxide-dependent heme synthase n=1 Tax=Rosistilla oblonga TaxID=2527990 RepID=UPI001189712E|nr:hydrogen peroxide-dependent heme synthase [Rosistilla oblonga]QDV11787.1 putative heme peroxidase [Rosistilla oblonga]
MNQPAGRPHAASQSLPEPSRTPSEGLHCSHFMYRFRRDVLAGLSARRLRDGMRQFLAAVDPAEATRPEKLQRYIISGHKADFALMMMDADPLKIDAVHQAVVSGPLGAAVEATWSFVSMSEISEYVPSVPQYREKLIREGNAPDSPELAAKVAAYERRLPMMNQQRLSPDIPDWPAACFYPMNKSRVPGANWFMESSSLRQSLMAEHAQSGMAFAGRVSQLITVGVGLDDWEWMVTLWGRNPEHLKEIVYRMRFDQASAKYGEFGPFYVGYSATGEEILDHCRINV